MVIEITEAEMLDRYCDGLKRASSRAKEFTVASGDKKPELFVDFIDSLKVAAGSAHQLAHAQENPKWLSTRDLLEGVIAVSQSITVFTNDDNPFWNQIEGSLNKMIHTGKTLATSKAMKRVDVLAHLEAREKNASSRELSELLH